MALVVSYTRDGVRIHVCYDGADDRLFEKDPSDPSGKAFKIPTVNPGYGHDVDCYDRKGWSIRGGRLPICPLHSRDGDEKLFE